MIRVFAYLAWHSAWNRFTRQVRRLRTPRYLVALLLGLFYLWAITEQQRSARQGADASSAEWVLLFASLGAAGAVAWAWLIGSERRALLFSPADVTFLFAGPVTRQALVQYKLVRAQLPVLFNVLLWTLLLSRERFGASPSLRAVSIWVLLTTLSLHRLGASFARSSVTEHGSSGLRRRAGSVAVAAAAIAVLAWATLRAAPDLAWAGRAGGIDALLSVVGEMVAHPPLRWLLVPFELMVRPLTVPDSRAWVAAMWPALGILAVHFIWVVRSDAAFEEAAVEHTLARARRERPEERKRRTLSASGRRLPRVLRLTAIGWPAGAILWKNLVSVIRVRPIRGAVIAGIAAGIGSALLSFGLEASVAEIVGWLALMWAVVMLLVGPQWIRNDLRSDLPHFDLLRSYPLRGRSIIAAEAAGSAVMVTVVQLGLLTVAYLAFLGNEALQLTLSERTLVLAAAVAYLPAVNYLAMLIQNGAALLFPAWVRGDVDRAGGVEALGQNMLLIMAHAGTLLVLMIVPAVAATGLYLVLRPMVGAWAEIGRAAVFIPLVAFEARVIVGWLGGVLDRTDPLGMANGS
jgi:ABC-2 type transport system permease protein